MRRKYNNSPRTIIAKFAGTCACCGAPIAAGEMVDWYPAKKAIAHMGGLEGNSARCTAEIRKRNAGADRDPGFVDLDRAFEDACAEVCGR